MDTYMFGVMVRFGDPELSLHKASKTIILFLSYSCVCFFFCLNMLCKNAEASVLSEQTADSGYSVSKRQPHKLPPRHIKYDRVTLTIWMPRESSSGLLRSLKAKRSVFSQSMEILWRYWSASVNHTCRGNKSNSKTHRELLNMSSWLQHPSFYLLSQLSHMNKYLNFPLFFTIMNILMFLSPTRAPLFAVIRCVLSSSQKRQDFIVHLLRWRDECNHYHFPLRSLIPRR